MDDLSAFFKTDSFKVQVQSAMNFWSNGVYTSTSLEKSKVHDCMWWLLNMHQGDIQFSRGFQTSKT